MKTRIGFHCDKLLKVMTLARGNVLNSALKHARISKSPPQRLDENDRGPLNNGATLNFSRWFRSICMRIAQRCGHSCIYRGTLQRKDLQWEFRVNLEIQNGSID